MLPDQQIDRRNHAGALLLPDGSVWSGGGAGPEPYMRGDPQPSWNSFEVYKPKYMFQGQRPEITDVGGIWQVGGSQRIISVADYGYQVNHYGFDGEIKRAALIRYGVTTHHDDQHQRYIELPLVFPATEFPDGSQQVIVLPPPSEDVAPKGYYMLVVINGNDVPSQAVRVQLL